MGLKHNVNNRTTDDYQSHSIIILSIVYDDSVVIYNQRSIAREGAGGAGR